MTAENSFIACPERPGRMCQTPTCVANPFAPDCVQFERGRTGKPAITTPQLLGASDGPLEQSVIQIYKAAGRLN